MTREELIEQLRALRKELCKDDPENDHYNADELLLEYINDPEVTAAYRRITRWFA